jgi:hypothetical protein
MNPTDAAIVSVIGHGGIQQVVDSGLTWEWVEDEDAQRVVKEAMTLHLRGQPVNITNVMLRIPIKDWNPVLSAWSDGYGSTASEAVAKSKSEYLRRQVGVWLTESNMLWRESPHEVRQWWPKQVMQANRLMKTGEIYSPRPSKHASNPIPEIVGTFPNPKFNTLLTGGIWKPSLIGMSSVSGGGKTTTAISLAGNMCEVGTKNVIVSSEMPEQYYVYRVMRYFGFSKTEFTSFVKHPDESDRCLKFKEYLNTLDSSLSIYGAQSMSADGIETILEVERPDVLQIDHLLAMRMTSKRQNDSMALGDLIYALQDLSNRFMCCIIVYGQLSASDAQEFQKNHDLPFVKFFGSAIVNQALRLAALTCRYWLEPPPGGLPQQYYRVKKNSLDECGDIDTEHFMGFDALRACYI